MSNNVKSKAKAAKKRAQLKNLRLKEEQALANNAARLCALTSGFSRTKRTAAEVAAFEQSKMPKYNVPKREIAHVEQRFIGPDAKPKQVLSPEMAEREQAAQERYKEMKKLVQPLYNKGGPQYPDASAVEAARRGELRRRS
jgi:hypothetical protein